MTDGVHAVDARAPDGVRLYAIGDVHGCRKLLVDLHARIDEQIARDRPADWRIVHVGDYCDRGPDSKGVIDFLLARMAADERVICLRGNHDEGFRSFLASTSPVPGRDGLVFTGNGGETTAASYGVSADFATIGGLARTKDELLRAVPHAHQNFLENLPYSVEYGDFFFCHAGIKPGVALTAQEEDDLIWIRGPFLDHPQLHPKVVVHGHTPAPEVEMMPNRINIDTHAYASGRLSALIVDGERKGLLEVSGEPS